MNEWFFVLMGALLAELLAMVRLVTRYDAPLRRRYVRWRERPHLTLRDGLELAGVLLPIFLLVAGLFALEIWLAVKFLIPDALDAEPYAWLSLGVLVSLFLLAELAGRSGKKWKEPPASHQMSRWRRIAPLATAVFALVGVDAFLVVQFIAPHFPEIQLHWVAGGITAAVLSIGLLLAWIHERRQQTGADNG